MYLTFGVQFIYKKNFVTAFMADAGYPSYMQISLTAIDMAVKQRGCDSRIDRHIGSHKHQRHFGKPRTIWRLYIFVIPDSNKAATLIKGYAP